MLARLLLDQTGHYSLFLLLLPPPPPTYPFPSPNLYSPLFMCLYV